MSSRSTAGRLSAGAVSALEAETLSALGATRQALDAYKLAQLVGASPMDTGRALVQLHRRGLVCTDDPQGTVNDLACRFALA